MNNFRALLKIGVHVLLVIAFVISSCILYVVISDLHARRKRQVQLCSFFARLSLKVMGIRLRINGVIPANGNFLLVANHTGFIDIFLLSSICQGVFVTSVDLRETPGLGEICKLGACLFVDRRTLVKIKGELVQVREVLQRGLSVILFPEAAANDGKKIYPFKKTLIASVAGTDTPILPAVINFRKINGEPMSHKWRDHVFWWGDMSFFASAWRAHQLKSIEVEIDFFQPVFCESEDHRTEVTRLIQHQVESKYTPVEHPTSVQKIGEMDL